MSKYLKFFFMLAVVAAMFSSCKKSTSDTSILEGHKWQLSTDVTTYSDSPNVQHNNITVDSNCTTTSYMEFHAPQQNAVIKLMYTYTKESCNPSSPNVNTGSWDIDPDNTVLYLFGDPTQVDEGGQWYNIVSISSSQIVLTQVSQGTIGFTAGGFPIYHTVTETFTVNTTTISI